MEYPLIVERADGVGVSVRRWWLLRSSMCRGGLYRNDFLSMSRGYKKLRIPWLYRVGFSL